MGKKGRKSSFPSPSPMNVPKNRVQFILSKPIYRKRILNGKEITRTTFKDVPLLPQSRVPFLIFNLAVRNKF